MTDFPRAENVGVIAADVYFPSTYVPQEELEKFDGVKEGKYTKGLGQEAMAVCDSREDINSICMTAVHSLMEKYNVPWEQIGRLEVGTETLVDKSKSVKSTLMQLFEKHDCHEIEGVDTINACYGGTSALFNALAWCESSAWDGRYALVVAADIAVYDRGAARPTGGVGAVAMLVGPDAPIVIEPGIRGTHMEHAFDFYKPQMVSEYPTVDGHLSNRCYIRALDNCYQRYSGKFEQRIGRPLSLNEDVDFAIFHQPYAKLVQKSWARLAWNDFLNQGGSESPEGLGEFMHLANSEDSLISRELEKAALKASAETFESKVAPSMVLGKQVGNSYCGSLYNGMASLVDAKGSSMAADTDGLVDKRVLMFSYGSGLAASMFSVKIRKSVDHIKDALNLQERLAQRVALDPAEFHETLDKREREYTKFDYQPSEPVDHYFPGTYYLDKVDELHRRTYSRVGGSQSRGLSTRAGAQFSNSHAVSGAVADPFNMAGAGGSGSARGYSSGSPLPQGTVADPFNFSLDSEVALADPMRTTARLGASTMRQKVQKPLITRGYSTAARQLCRALRYIR